ncbi:protein S40-7 [Cornus florida]|uniref:protein S40-7 n=1 Tax=Cornus florida TaxID=4283 RepID=UPI00289C901E|nr:protein S40-7 [Cornus florida]
MADEDFQEEEVWAHLVKEREDSSPKMTTTTRPRSKDSSASSSSSSAWRLPAAPRVIPRATESTGTSQQSSAPVNIPDWSKIYKKKNAKKGSMVDDDDEDQYGTNNADVEDDDDDEMVPPHEYIARKLARTQITSFSMCEGVGRTLKGRDLSKVRNAILTKTGFLE